ncbi:hypothetical protein ACNQGL_07735 [Flavobacterium sp. LB3P21]
MKEEKLPMEDNEIIQKELRIAIKQLVARAKNNIRKRNFLEVLFNL